MLWEVSWRSEQNHTVELAPAVQLLLERCRAKASDLRAVVVAIGPGGFSALRVGLALAKGMAEALGIPIVGIGTLEVEAFPYRGVGSAVWPVLPLGRREVAWAVFQNRDGLWEKTQAERVGTPDELCVAVAPPALVCGEAAVSLLPLLADRQRQGVAVAKVGPPTRHAATLALMGWERLTRGQRDDVATLQPLYLRRPSITPPRSA
jgi:tRNA threonylcarbamoyl adenosine modification protein YeaZ